MRFLGILFTFITLLISQATFAENTEEEMTPEQQQYIEEARKIWESLDRQTGEITLPNGVARLTVPESFYYLNPEDSETVLVKVWGNLPGAGTESQGMLIPTGVTPFDRDSWGVTIEYEEDGYVSDEDADEINYDDLLDQMKDDTTEASKERVKQGYEPIQLVGWAAHPFYDKQAHKLHWAKEIKFGDSPDNTLNYNIRVLGRKGVLVLNFIAGMSQKEMVNSKLDTVLAMAEFNDGYRYDEFDPSIDKVAAYGLGALVAGKVIAKTGLIAAALLLLKKFGVFIAVGIAALFGKLFKRKEAA